MTIHQIGTFGPLLIILSFPIRVHDSLKRRSIFIDGFLDATDKLGRIVVACGRWQTIADVHQGVGKFFYDGWCGLLGQKGEHEGGVGWIHGDDDIRETLMWVAHQRFLLFSSYDIEQGTSGCDGCDDCVIASHH